MTFVSSPPSACRGQSCAMSRRRTIHLGRIESAADEVARARWSCTATAVRRNTCSRYVCSQWAAGGYLRLAVGRRETVPHRAHTVSTANWPGRQRIIAVVCFACAARGMTPYSCTVRICHCDMPITLRAPLMSVLRFNWQVLLEGFNM